MLGKYFFSSSVNKASVKVMLQQWYLLFKSGRKGAKATEKCCLFKTLVTDEAVLLR